MNTEQKGRHLRPVRRDAGQTRWTERDLVVLPWIGDQYAVRLDQIHALLSRQPLGTTKENMRVAETTVRHCLERWRRAGVAQSMALVVGEPGWVWLTREGQRLAGLEYPFWTLSLSHLDHLYACNQAQLWVEAQKPGAGWRSERALRSEQAWVEARERLGHRPAAEVLIAGQTRAVEVLTGWHQQPNFVVKTRGGDVGADETGEEGIPSTRGKSTLTAVRGGIAWDRIPARLPPVSGTTVPMPVWAG